MVTENSEPTEPKEAVIEEIVEVVATTTPPKPLTPVELVEKYSEEFGANPKLAKAIVRCESEWNQYAKNPGSSAAGYFQFIDSTWYSTLRRMGLPADTSKFDPVLSIKAGVWLLAEDGSGHWYPSEHCWGNIV